MFSSISPSGQITEKPILRREEYGFLWGIHSKFSECSRGGDVDV